MVLLESSGSWAGLSRSRWLCRARGCPCRWPWCWGRALSFPDTASVTGTCSRIQKQGWGCHSSESDPANAAGSCPATLPGCSLSPSTPWDVPCSFPHPGMLLVPLHTSGCSWAPPGMLPVPIHTLGCSLPCHPPGVLPVPLHIPGCSLGSSRGAPVTPSTSPWETGCYWKELGCSSPCSGQAGMAEPALGNEILGVLPVVSVFIVLMEYFLPVHTKKVLHQCEPAPEPPAQPLFLESRTGLGGKESQSSSRSSPLPRAGTPCTDQVTQRLPLEFASLILPKLEQISWRCQC